MNSDLEKSIAYIKKNSTHNPRLAIILGSGLGSFADMLSNPAKISTKSIPFFPVSTVKGHQGFLVFGNWEGVELLALQGRTHYYEGYSIGLVTYVIRIFKEIGIETLIITNAAGGVNKNFVPGDLMLITDQINNMFKNPLRGPLKYGGERFPDMSDAYSQKYFKLVRDVAEDNHIKIKEGTLYVSSGPSYETAAEVRMIRKIGGDAASMSTVPEIIVANQCGLETIGISCITNYATGLTDQPLTHEEVTETAKLVQKKFLKLISGIILRIGQY
jgi:purine-nucleoside phosphorylase